MHTGNFPESRQDTGNEFRIPAETFLIPTKETGKEVALASLLRAKDTEGLCTTHFFAEISLSAPAGKLHVFTDVIWRSRFVFVYSVLSLSRPV